MTHGSTQQSTPWKSLPARYLLLLLATRKDITASGHLDLGLHGLSGEDPVGTPVLPSIQGAFQVELNARFINVSTDAIHNVFEYSTVGHSDTIFFGVHTAGTANSVLHLVINVGGTPYNCTQSIAPLANDTLYNYKFGVSTTNTAEIYQNRVLEATCTGVAIPLNVPRNHFLGTGTLDGTAGTKRMEGAVAGLRVTNAGQQQHPQDAYALWNLPGQPFASGFVASFYARFDRVNQDRNFQILFDIARDRMDNNILCGQVGFFDSFYCQVFEGPVATTTIVAPNAILQGEFAFWHFGVQHLNMTTSRLWIEKNGAQVMEVFVSDLQIQNVFRPQMVFGSSTFNLVDRAVDGVILGFRLDRALSS